MIRLRVPRFGAARTLFGMCLSAVLLSASAAAQPRDTRMLITVVDQTNAVIPDATVTVTSMEPAAQKVELPPVKTTTTGLATISGLTPGRYTARAEFPGRESGAG